MTTTERPLFGRKPAPSAEEQRALAAFAERKTATFDIVGKPKPEAVEGLTHAIRLLRMSPTGNALYERAMNAGYRFELDSTLDCCGTADSETKTIAISSRYEANQMVSTLAHELRHAWQFEDGIIQRAGVHPDDILLFQRATEADAEAVSAVVCLELRREEFGLPMYEMFRATPKIIRGISDEAGDGPIGPRAVRAAYDAWFEDKGRMKYYDNLALKCADQEMTARTPREPRLDQAMMTKLGTLPDGTSYLENSSRLSPLADVYREPTSIFQKLTLSGLRKRHDALRTTAAPASPRLQSMATPPARPTFGRRPAQS